MTEESAAAELLRLTVAYGVARELFGFLLGSCSAELPKGQLVSIEGYVAVFAGQRDLGADTGICTGGACEGRDRARLKRESRDGEVLALDIVAAEAHLRGDRLRLAEKLEHKIDGMYRLIHKRSAAVHFPGAAPTAVCGTYVAEISGISLASNAEPPVTKPFES